MVARAAFEPPPDARQLVGSVAWKRDGIVYVVIQSALFDVAEAASLVDAGHELAGGAPAPFYVDIRAQRHVTREGRSHASVSALKGTARAAGVVIGSSVTRLIANLYIRMARPPFPVKMFDDPERAVAWLRTFRDE